LDQGVGQFTNLASVAGGQNNSKSLVLRHVSILYGFGPRT
jgi:hypothetical protein